MKFELILNKETIKEMKNILEDYFDCYDLKTDNDVIKQFFVLEDRHNLIKDFRDNIKISRKEND